MKAIHIWTILFLVLAAAFLTGCTGQQAQSAPPMDTPATMTPAVTPASDTLRVADTSLGTILVDSAGKSLYYFANDVPSSGASACAGKCAAVWPAFFADPVRVSSPLDPVYFSTITRADGSRQTTYHGWPLYYYQSDVSPGDVMGENVLNAWWVMKPDESILIARTPALGSYLTDTSGRTLYFLATDMPGRTTCSGPCLAKWPAFSATMLTAPSVLAPADFSTAQRTDGVSQIGFKDHLLYYFSGDNKPGDTNGQGFNGVWYVANITGSVPATPLPLVTPLPVTTTVPTTVIVRGDASDGGGGY